MIHPSAIIEDGASIGPDCRIGPFCHIGAGVRLRAGVHLHSHVAITGDTVVGDETEIWPFASVGSQPQDLKFAGESSQLRIGARNMIRESVSINPGTAGGGGLTQIGDDCLFMLGTHVGHDCRVGNGVVIANHASLAGHVQVGDGAIIGGLAGIHQFVRIGEGAIIGALSMVVADVIPFGSVSGERPRLAGLNLIGLKRRGLSRDEISALRAAYKALFAGEGTLRTRAEAMLEGAENAQVRDILDFILSDSERSFCTPKAK
ncbi:MAG TPA: acyl-ACP--UDP-N-acetylglucosamine O-acyltransferase [Rhodobacteraceae bacterium]|nr:acyl-ACP--UDP-N-acetylglucosamine O-acyltransferase [Paracoccaceae bacterium]